ncbi:MAG: hypothetical protein QOC99_1136 [Acidobacteriota bacterium]|jgi:hypothetical protein|nr:hypothetical protein [Acidobacteriota bacterium]
MKCARCGTAPESGEVFCGECGQRLTPASTVAQGAAQSAAAAPHGSRAALGLCGVLFLVIGLTLLAGGGLAAWLWFGHDTGGTTVQSSDGTSKSHIKLENYNVTKTSPPTPRQNATVVGSTQRNDSPIRKPGGDNPTVVWGPRNDRASLNGERLTYYQGSTPEQCESDCDGNQSCKGFTFIRPGAYNTADPPMCYLLSAVTEVVPHDCCVSGVKNGQ